VARPDAGSRTDSVARVEYLRRLIREGRSADAVRQADVYLAGSAEPYLVMQCLLMKIGALMNLTRHSECPAVIDQAFEANRTYPDPTLTGELHALTAFQAYLEGSLDRCVSHLVRSSRALSSVDRPDMSSADAWVDLALTYSGIGFHGHALGALDRGRRIAAAAGLPPFEYIMPEIRVRLAVSLDHRGDSDGCVRVLRDVLSHLPSGTTDQVLDEIPPVDGPYIGYALSRLAAMGEPIDLVPGPFLGSRRAYDPESEYLRQLATVCADITDGRSSAAIAKLDRIHVQPRTLGAAEPPRLRAIAWAAAGDHAAANRADREAFRLTAQAIDRLRDLFIDGVAARLDHDDLRRTVARYADEALTDPLTGLPNRRHLEQHVESMGRRGESGVIGVLDLDAFKAVNTIHGHLSGDLVLQRAAAVINRVMRRGDFVARYGGDEFVVVLPSTKMPEAYEIANRIRTAFTTEDWDALVPGTPVGVSIGWADLDLRSGVQSGFEAADRAMYAAKHAAKAS
jgi:diguanylate cyclase (GGDEF)-like protein